MTVVNIVYIFLLKKFIFEVYQKFQRELAKISIVIQIKFIPAETFVIRDIRIGLASLTWDFFYL